MKDYKLKEPIDIQGEITTTISLKEKKDIKWFPFVAAAQNAIDNPEQLVGYIANIDTRTVNELGFEDGAYITKYLQQFESLLASALSEEVEK